MPQRMFKYLLTSILLIYYVQLETDPLLLVPKAKQALKTYKHQVILCL